MGWRRLDRDMGIGKHLGYQLVCLVGFTNSRRSWDGEMDDFDACKASLLFIPTIYNTTQDAYETIATVAESRKVSHLHRIPQSISHLPRFRDALSKPTIPYWLSLLSFFLSRSYPFLQSINQSINQSIHEPHHSPHRRKEKIPALTLPYLTLPYLTLPYLELPHKNHQQHRPDGRTDELFLIFFTWQIIYFRQKNQAHEKKSVHHHRHEIKSKSNIKIKIKIIIRGLSTLFRLTEIDLVFFLALLCSALLHSTLNLRKQK